VRVTNNPNWDKYTNFLAVLVGGSTCTKGFANVTCTWYSPAGATYDRLVNRTTEDCICNPTPGSTAAWRYGCSLGLNPNNLIDGTNGWESLPVTYCQAYQGKCQQRAVYDTVTANDDAYTGVVRRPTLIPPPGVLFNDGGPAASTHRATLITPPPSGILRLKPNGAFVYIPTTVGTVTFTYRVTDSSGTTDDATVTITTTERSRR